MAKSPALVAFMGDDEYRRHKNMNKLLRALSADHWKILHVEFGIGELALGWQKIASFGGVFFKQKTVYVLHTPIVGSGMHRMKGVDQDFARKIDARVLAQVEKPDTSLLFVIDTKEKPSTKRTEGFLDVPISKVAAKWRMSWTMPAFYKLDSRAESMCQEVASEYGKQMSAKIAKSVVQVVGNDLGTIENEVRKYALYANSRGDSEIEVAHIKGLIAQVGEVEMAPFISAVASRNVKKVVQHLGWIRNTHGADPTMKVTMYLANMVSKWFLAASLHEAGVSADSGAANLEVNPWYYKNQILPPAKRWGSSKLRSLVGDLAEIERSVLKGHLSPWTLLESRILRACKNVSREPHKGSSL